MLKLRVSCTNVLCIRFLPINNYYRSGFDLVDVDYYASIA